MTALPRILTIMGSGETTPNMARVHRAILDRLGERPVPAVDLYHVTVDTVTVADTVAALARRLPRVGSATFRELTRHLTSRMEIIVSFLALLELCKQGRIALDQGHTFGDLDVVWLATEREPVPVGDGLYDEYEG